MKHTQKGFTLVELLVVIAILAILATVSVVGYTAYIDKANNSVAMQEAQPYESMIRNEATINGSCVVGKVGTDEVKVTYDKSNKTFTVTAGSSSGGVITLDNTVFGSDAKGVTAIKLVKGTDNKYTIVYENKSGETVKGSYTFFSNK